MSINEALETIKMAVRSARQNAYLGVYEESIKSFNKALEAIRRHCKTLDDQILISEWKSTEKDLFNELTVVIDLKNIVQGLKNVPGKHPISEGNVPPQRQGGYDNGPSNYVQEKKADKQDRNREERRLPFNQEPFNLKQNDGMEEENKNDKQNYVYVPSRREKEKQNNDKDPDVWDPPSPKADRGRRGGGGAIKQAVNSKAEPSRREPRVKNKPELDHGRVKKS